MKNIKFSYILTADSCDGTPEKGETKGKLKEGLPNVNKTKNLEIKTLKTIITK